MIGDNIETNIGGGKAVGMHGVLVRTGKYRQGCAEGATYPPDAVMDSFSDLFEILRL